MAEEATLGAARSRAPGSERRLIAVGDIHGAFNGFRSILREAALVDDKGHWIGGDAILVQTGDFLDRGPGAAKVANLLMDLQEEAPRHGGEVIVLLGNHEVLNLIADRRDVTKYIVRNVVDGHSEKRLNVLCNSYASYYRRLAQRQRKQMPKRRDLLDKCFAEQQLGLVEYLREIGPEGRIGRWLRTLPVAVQIDGVIFIRGGIGPAFAGRPLEQINREVQREIKSFDRARDYLVDEGFLLPIANTSEIVSVAVHLAKAAESANPDSFPLPGGPQGHGERQNLAHGARGRPAVVPRLRPLERTGRVGRDAGDPRALRRARHIVAAHTPQASRKITPRFDSRVFLIDTGMLTEFYKGRPSALEIQEGRFTAIYAMQKTVLHEPAPMMAAE